MNELSIVLCGEAGQGIQTVEKLFTRVLKKAGFNVFSTKEYMSRVRGGSNSTLIRVSNKAVNAYVDNIDILIPLSKQAVDHLSSRIDKNTLIIGEKSFVKELNDCKCFEVSFSEVAKDIGNIIYANSIAIGFLSFLCNVDISVVKDEISNYFSKKDKKIIDKNIEAAMKGFSLADENFDVMLNDPVNDDVLNDIVLNGTEALGLGALAGGCNFVSSYPMSPSTGVLTFLARYSKDFDLVVEQAEDEISAVNMVLGAWYAGARGLVTTSGGGFALMTEGVSLAGMIESPLVVHLSQRPGPATGLPTRTEQGDLLHVLFSAHGDFPKVVFAPATIEDGFVLMCKAFDIADRFQVPVFVLSDQYFVDSFYNVSEIKLDDIKYKDYFVKTDKNYKRYKLTKNGVSPRGIPDFGKGLVCVDSDEHDEFGRITEDMHVRTKMVDKRLRKLKDIEKEVIEPRFYGGDKYRYLVIAWGSTYNIIKEALSRLDNDDISYLHFSQVFPINKDIEKYLKRADKTIVIENNATSQFAKLIKLETGFEIDYSILQYDGLAFSVEKIQRELNSILKEVGS